MYFISCDYKVYKKMKTFTVHSQYILRRQNRITDLYMLWKIVLNKFSRKSPSVLCFKNIYELLIIAWLNLSHFDDRLSVHNTFQQTVF